MTIDSPPPIEVDHAFAGDLLDFIEEEVSQIDDPLETSSDLLLTGAVDSMGVVLVVQWIEDRLDIVIDPGDVVLEHFVSVDAMVEYLRARSG